jgi:hypothetical protein
VYGAGWKVQGAWVKVQGSKIKARGARYKAQGARIYDLKIALTGGGPVYPLTKVQISGRLNGREGDLRIEGLQ